jgi:putative nucleotidyltransferase with HDIG domain
MRLKLLGRHLHSQIIIPLMAATLVVAVVASFIGVSELSKVLGTWIDGNIKQTMGSVSARLDAERQLMEAHGALLAEDERLRSALQAGFSGPGKPFDGGDANRFLVAIRPAVNHDNIMLMDASGTVVASTGRLQVPVGEKPLPTRYVGWTRLGMTFTSLVGIAGKETLTSFNRVLGPDGEHWSLAISDTIDDRYLERALAGLGGAFAYFDSGGRFVARFIDPSTASTADAANLAAELRADDPQVASALREQGRGLEDLSLGGRSYRMLARPIGFGPTLDPAGGTGSILAIVSTDVQDQAGTATMRLIALWSAFAAILLTGFGMVVARRVSAPLSRLANSARLIAEGDFSHKVPMTGSNEISELAESFNQMTESLRQRTEGVTRKVLELATLYEMSRALGSTLDLDTLLDAVLDSALRIFNVESGYAVLRDRNTERLELRALRGAQGGRPDERALRNSMSEWVSLEGRPLIYNPPLDGEGARQVDQVTGATAALCVPLVSNEGVIGAVTVGSRDAAFRFTSDDVRLLSTIANHATIAIGNIELFSSLQEAYVATVRSLAAAVDAKDPYTRGHSDRVAEYAMAVAEKLDLSPDQRTALEMAAYLHDIGKIGIREEILLKPGRLDDGEMEQMRHHPLIGANILKPVAFPWAIAPIVRHHHEHWDGAGYPAGLRGEEIPLLARVLAAADACEAMTSDRPYRRGRTVEDAIEELKRCSGSQFDPRVVDAFVLVLRDEQERGGDVARRLIDEIQSDEARAIFVAICDGMLSSFRRLGGPRLSSNLENELNRHFATEDMPYSFSGGRLTGRWDAEMSRERELEHMRATVSILAASMSRTSGHSLVDGFHAEALEGLSDRMRRIAEALELYRKP